MTSHLRVRNGPYYFRLRIPSDLHNLIQPAEILKSLHTKDRKSARIAASNMLPGFLQVFTLARTGFISQEQASERLCDLLSRKRKGLIQQTTPQNSKPTQAPSPLLSQMINEYIKDKQAGWTDKTLLEYQGYFKLLQDVL